jgi:hypothetical protein
MHIAVNVGTDEIAEMIVFVLPDRSGVVTGRSSTETRPSPVLWTDSTAREAQAR